MCLLEKFLCCCELTTGALIIGWINVVWGIYQIIAAVIALTGAEELDTTSLVAIIILLTVNVALVIVSGVLIRGVKTVSLRFSWCFRFAMIKIWNFHRRTQIMCWSLLLSSLSFGCSSFCPLSMHLKCQNPIWFSMPLKQQSKCLIACGFFTPYTVISMKNNDHSPRILIHGNKNWSSKILFKISSKLFICLNLFPANIFSFSYWNLTLVVANTSSAFSSCPCFKRKKLSVCGCVNNLKLHLTCFCCIVWKFQLIALDIKDSFT